MSTFAVKDAEVLINGQFKKTSVLVLDNKIEAVTDIIPPSYEVVDGSQYKLVPGFFDNHTHGCMGIDFNLAGLDDIQKAATHYASWGVTGFLPAVMTDSPDVICKQLALCAAAALDHGCDAIRGIHLEGPFLNPAYKGAMPERFLLNPDYDLFMKFQDAARGMIKVVTISPELEGSVEFTKKVSAHGVRVSMGHSSASYEQTMACIEAGAASATHTMNAMKLLHMHDPAILTAVLESDIYCEMICDGFHLHPPIVRFLLKVKGLERMIPITDSMMAAGYPDGYYMLGVNKVVVENGDAKLVDGGTRAGSTLTMQKALKNILSFTGRPLEQVVTMMGENAPRMLGLDKNTGSIGVGKRADFILLDGNNEVCRTVINGKTVYMKDC